MHEVTYTSFPEVPEVALERARDARVTPEGLDMAISVLDLTELSATASPSSTRALVARALDPDRAFECPPVAAVCVHSQLVSAARGLLPDTGRLLLACVAGNFPLGKAPVEVRWEEVRRAVADGADEVDIVIDQAAVAEADFDSIATYVAECVEIVEAGGAQLKVILESGELGSLEAVWTTAHIALSSGAHFLKTSTGFAERGATLEAAALLALAVRSFSETNGVQRGIKISGGVASPEQAVQYLEVVRQLGLEVTPEVFRFGASGLLGALVAARRGEASLALEGY